MKILTISQWTNKGSNSKTEEDTSEISDNKTYLTLLTISQRRDEDPNHKPMEG
jgi:hypothetical protein